LRYYESLDEINNDITEIQNIKKENFKQSFRMSKKGRVGGTTLHIGDDTQHI
jgi:hypothetical protein